MNSEVLKFYQTNYTTGLQNQL